MRPYLLALLLPGIALLVAPSPVSAQSFTFSFGSPQDEAPISEEPYPGVLKLSSPEFKPGEPFRIRLSASIPSKAVGNSSAEIKFSNGDTLVSEETSYSFQSVNGVRSSLMIFTFFGDAPSVPGEYKIPAQTITVGKGRITVPETILKVRALAPGEAAYGPASVFLKIAPGTYYSGQEIQAQLTIVDGTDEHVIVLRNLRFAGGEDLAIAYGPLETGVETIDGESRPVRTLKLRLRPSVTGEKTLSATVDVSVTHPDTRGAHKPRRIVSPGVALKVIHAPEAGKPASYLGAIGRYSVSPMQVPPGEKKAGEPFDLEFTVSGEGSLDHIVPPELAAENWAVRVRDPQILVDAEGRPSRRFVYTVTPAFGGDITVPSGELSWFDPVEHTYKRVSLGGMPVSVTGPSAPALAAAKPKDIIPVLAEDPAPSGKKIAYATIARAPAFLYTQLALAAGLLVSAAVFARRRHLAAHPGLVTRIRATRLMKQHRAKARSALSRRDISGYAGHARAALRAGIAPSLRAEAGALTGEETLAALPVDETAKRNLAPLFSGENAERFGKEPAAVDLAGSADTLFATLRNLEKSLR